MKKIKVLLADDHLLTVWGAQFVLEQMGGIEVVGTATNGVEALKIVQTKEVNVAVLDIEMPLMDGVEATRRIKAFNPEIKVLIMSMHNEIHMIKPLMAHGISGYLLKGKVNDYELLSDAVHAVYANRSYFMNEVIDTFIRGIPQPTLTTPPISILTSKEIEVLILVAEGYTSLEIGKRLGIARNTVDGHRRNILKKLRLSRSNDLVRYAIKHGLV